MFTMKHARADENTFLTTVRGMKAELFKDIWLEKQAVIDGYTVDAIRVMRIYEKTAEIILLYYTDTRELLKLKCLCKTISVYNKIISIQLNGKSFPIGKFKED